MPPTIDPSVTLADLVTGHPDLAAELEGRGLDFCCGGRRTLAEACESRNLDPDVVARELGERASKTAAVSAWAHLDAGALTVYIQETHHGYLHAELPRIAALAAKVHSVHGARHHELAAVQSTFAALRSDLEPHLAREEQVLFPMIRRLVADDPAPTSPAVALQGPIARMVQEHDGAGALLEQLRHLTDAYTAPPDGCASYHALYRALERLETDTHLHVHIENNRLFPMVVDRESQGRAVPTGTRR
jgi:regulator of cell morphogenesis and NO signaling